MSSTTRILILGVLLDGPLHGYKVRRQLEMMGADFWANVAYGSIYHGLNKMADEGLLTIVESGKAGKTVYELTDDGRHEFYRMLMTLWYEIKPVVDPFQVAITFMDRLDKPTLMDALRTRAEQLTASLAMSERAYGSKQRFGAPRHIDETLRLNIGMLQAQLEWCRQAAQKVEDDELP